MDSGAAPGDFAVVLRRLRESRSLTQEELAERSGLTAKAIGALERGERRRPYPHTVRSLADGLALDDDERSTLVTAVPSRDAVTRAPLDASPPRGGGVHQPGRLDRDAGAAAERRLRWGGQPGRAHGIRHAGRRHLHGPGDAAHRA